MAARRPDPRPAVPPPAGGPGPVPDVPNWAWHEYGMRAGSWRLKTCLEHVGAAVTVALFRRWRLSSEGLTRACLARIARHGALNYEEGVRFLIEPARIIRDHRGRAGGIAAASGAGAEWDPFRLLPPRVALRQGRNG